MEDAETRFAPGFSVSMLVLASTLFLGGVVLVIGYIVSRLSRSSRASDTPKNAEESQKVKFEDPRESIRGSVVAGPGSTTTGGTGAANNKRAKNKKRREAQQEFTHSWMVGALKGHTAPVLDMSFSSNGKFLASCAEDCGLQSAAEVLDPSDTGRYGECKASSREPSSSSVKPSSTSTSPSPSPLPRGKSKSLASSSASTASTGSSTTSASASSEASSGSSTKEDRAILSRRQRKNRTRAPRDQRQERDDEQDHEEDQTAEQQQQPQRVRRHHHCRQQEYPSSPTRSSSESLQGSSTSPRSGAAGSRRNYQLETAEDAHGSQTKPGEDVRTGAWNAGRESGTFLSSQRNELKHLSDAALASLLRGYTLTGDQLAHLGYPVECSYYPGYAAVVNHHQHPMGHRARGYHHLDVNAREFVPGSGITSMAESEVDSGNYSGSSVESSDLEQESASDSDKSSDIGESSSSSSSTDSSSYSSSCSSSGYGYHNFQERSRRYWTPDTYELVVEERQCARCHKNFYVNRHDGEYLKEDRCVYHWGKFRSGIVNGLHRNAWECCQGRESSRGCTNARMHVWTGLSPGYNGPLDGYVCTQPAGIVPSDGNYGVYALDCEMCFTRRGLELAKVTVVDMDGTVIYDTLVRPDAEVIDHNTRFSGITAKDLLRVSKRLRDVQMDLISFVHAETILIGHALDNDLRALRMLHSTVIDTCVAFPHFLGYPFRCSLKTLARTVLRREIQTTEHDSVEDARIAIDLMLRKVQHDFS